MPLSDLGQGWFIQTAIGIVIGVVGTLITLSVRPRSRLAAQTNSLQLLGRHPVLPQEIAFLFRGQEVPSVTLSRVAIWNIGNTTLRGDQIVTTDPLRVLTSASILDAVVLDRTRAVNAFTCSVRTPDNEVECKFDFLDPGDGALIQLIHTGDDKVGVTGTLRGVPKGVLLVGRQNAEKQSQPQSQTSPRTARLIGFLSCLGGIAAAIAGFLSHTPKEARELTGFGLILAAIGSFVIWFARFIPPASLNIQLASNPPKKPLWKK